MADHNEAMRLADWLKARQSHLGSSRDSCWEDDRSSWDDYDKAAATLLQQAERIAELQSAHAIAVEIAAQYAAERDQLREEVERMRAPLSEEQIWFLTNDGMRNAAGGIYKSSVIAFARAVEWAHLVPAKGSA